MVTVRTLVAAGALVTAFAASSLAQIAVSSNDNKTVNLNGVNTVVRNPQPDTATIIDVGVSPPKVIAEIPTPGNWQAPPQSVAISPDESIALVTNSSKIDPADPTKTTPDDDVGD
jgi:hypothetical protein